MLPRCYIIWHFSECIYKNGLPKQLYMHSDMIFIFLISLKYFLMPILIYIEIFISLKLTRKLLQSALHHFRLFRMFQLFFYYWFSSHSEHITYNQNFNLFGTCCITHHVIPFGKCHMYLRKMCGFTFSMFIYVHAYIKKMPKNVYRF